MPAVIQLNVIASLASNDKFFPRQFSQIPASMKKYEIKTIIGVKYELKSHWNTASETIRDALLKVSLAYITELTKWVKAQAQG